MPEVFRESRIAFQVAVWMSLTSMLPLVLVSFARTLACGG